MNFRGNICYIGSRININIKSKKQFINEATVQNKKCIMLCNKLNLENDNVFFCSTYEEVYNHVKQFKNQGVYLFFNYRWIKNRKKHTEDLKEIVYNLLKNEKCKVLAYFSMKNLDVDFLEDISLKFERIIFESEENEQVLKIDEIKNIKFLIKSIQGASMDNLLMKKNQKNLQILNDAIIKLSFENDLESAIESALKTVLQITHAGHGSITVIIQDNKIEKDYSKTKIDKTYSYRIYCRYEIVGILTLGYKEDFKNRQEDDYIINIICKSLGDVIRTFKEKEEGRLLKSRGDKIKLTGEVAGGIVHDLNNVFSIIKGYTQLLQINKEAKDISEYMNIIGDTVNEAIAKIKTIQDFSRNINDCKKFMVVNNLIEILIETTRPKWENMGYISGKNINIVTSLRSVKSIYIQESSLKEALVNMILNSTDSLSIYGGTIWINTYDDDENVIIEIIDNGIGIDNELLDKIFDPFFTTKGKSTGLGLSIVKKNVEHSGGQVKVFSQKGKITKFVIKLPITEELD